MQSYNPVSGPHWAGDSFVTAILLAFCRRVPYFRGKGTLFRWAGHLLLRDQLHLRSGRGVRLAVDSNDYIGRTMAYEGGFESKSLALAEQIMSSGGVFLDVGCNFGLFTVSVGTLPKVECIAIDASFVALSKLLANLRKNPAVKARIVNGALGPERAIHCLEVPAEGNLGGTRIASEGSEGNASRFWTAGVTLQEVLEKLGPESIRLLKIDVEGFELPVFRGLDFGGVFRPANVIMECDLQLFGDAERGVDHLLAQGYEAMTVEGEPVGDFGRLPENNLWLRDAKRRTLAHEGFPN